MNPPAYSLHRGTTPLIVSVPHTATAIPEALQAAYRPRALEVEDTDWHLDRLYAFARELGASLLLPRWSRYVIDLNRPSDDTPMYAGAHNTELCPTRFFTGEPLYRPGHAPDAAEVARRLDAVWRPYHAALTGELERVRAVHGHAVLFDAHSIASELPWLFEGRLPALNLGTVDGTSCDPGLRRRLTDLLEAQTLHSHAVDARFKGGHITRAYGRPAEGWHTVQLEMCRRCYMTEAPPYELEPARVAAVTPLLRELLQAMRAWRPGG